MAEWEEKLEGILSNPQAMEQIMALAKSLEGGETSDSHHSATSAPPTPTSPSTSPPSLDISQLMGGMGKLDPKLLSIAGKLISQMGQQDDRRTALLQALRPFVKPERYAKLDRAIQIAKLSVMIRAGLELFRTKGDPDV